MKLKKSKLFCLHCSCEALLVIKFGEFKSDQILCQISQEILKASKNNCNSSKVFQPMYP